MTRVPTQETVEAIARAIYEARATQFHPKWEDVHPEDREYLCGNVRAVLATPEVQQIVCALSDAEAAISTLDEGAFGYVEENNPLNDPGGWPVRQELLAKVRTALSHFKAQEEVKADG